MSLRAGKHVTESAEVVSMAMIFVKCSDFCLKFVAKCALTDIIAARLTVGQLSRLNARTSLLSSQTYRRGGPAAQFCWPKTRSYDVA